jgi:hypothetical protein
MGVLNRIKRMPFLRSLTLNRNFGLAIGTILIIGSSGWKTHAFSMSKLENGMVGGGKRYLLTRNAAGLEMLGNESLVKCSLFFGSRDEYFIVTFREVSKRRVVISSGSLGIANTRSNGSRRELSKRLGLWECLVREMEGNPLRRVGLFFIWKIMRWQRREL